MIFSTSLISAFLAFSSFFEKGSAHGDHSSKRLARRMNFVSERSLSACQSSELLRRGMKRRAEKTKKIRRDLFPQLEQRDLAAVVNISHASNMTAYGDFLFGNNASCILDPEATQGPYYVEGEYIRKDVREDQEGIPLYFEFQVIDTNTCEPVTDAYFDIWHANATGVYSGIDVSGNGNDADATNVNKTFLRGLQGTDDEGLVEFETIFPGHYQGRATHIHVLSHINGTVFSNGTYKGGSVGHVGQVFWDTDLRAAAELTYPYNTNTQAVTTNEEDEWAAAEAENNYDPFADYVFLGDSVSDGILAWITVGMDTSENYYDDLYIAAELTANGGVQNSESFVDYESGGSNSTSTTTSIATSTAV